MAEIEKAFLIRDTKDDDGHLPSVNTPTHSPDIICYQNSILTYNDAKNSYKNYICKSFLQDTINLIYIRGKNNTGVAQNGEAKAFYCPLSLLYLPHQWKPLFTETGNEIVELWQAEYEKAQPDAIVLCNRPFVLQKVEKPNQHHCLMAMTRQKGEEWLELPENFDGNKELWAFLRAHSNMANNNIVIEKGFSSQHSEFVMIGNHNNYEEYYAIRFTLEKRSIYDPGTFDSCNIGRIQMLCTDINCPFDISIYPGKEEKSVLSEAFRLTAKLEKSIIITYYAADTNKKVYGTIKHEYVTCDVKNSLPLIKEQNSLHRTKRADGGNSIEIHPDAKIGDLVIVFSENEEESVKLLNLGKYGTD